MSISELDSLFDSLIGIDWGQCKEVTIEVNPDDLTKDYVEGLVLLPVNRISMGIQSFKDADLLSVLPESLSRPETQALSAAIRVGLLRLQDYSRAISMYAALRDLPDEVLNLLADSKISVSPESEKEKYTLGQRAADSIAKFAGSWAFIFSFTGVLILWMVVNTVLAAKAFDPYPFILLNLVLSCVAAIQAPLIMMSQNRQEEKDRRRAENDYKVNLKTEIMIEDLYDKVNAILAKQSALEKRLQNDGKNHTKQQENN